MNPHFTLCTCLAFLGGQLLHAPAQQPDILLLMPDQMRGDCLSVLGHPAVRTPHLDKLAEDGALFRRAYSTCPSCIRRLMASRALNGAEAMPWASASASSSTVPGAHVRSAMPNSTAWSAVIQSLVNST